MKGKRQNFRSYDLAQRLFGPNPDWRRVEWAHQSVGVLVYVAYVGGLGLMISAAVETALDPLRYGSIPIRIICVFLALVSVWGSARPIPRPQLLWAIWILWTIFSFFFLRQFFRSSPEFFVALYSGILFIGAISIPWIAVVLVWLRMVWRTGPDENYNLERTPPNELPALLERLQAAGAEILGLEVIWHNKPSEPVSIHGFVCHRWTAVKEVKEELLAYSRELSDTLSSQDFEYELLWREPANEALKTNSAKPVL